MGRAKITSKNQITIPADIRRELDLRPGDTIEFVKDSDGRIRLRRHFEENPFEKFRGSVKDFPWASVDEFIDEIRGGQVEQFVLDLAKKNEAASRRKRESST